MHQTYVLKLLDGSFGVITDDWLNLNYDAFYSFNAFLQKTNKFTTNLLQTQYFDMDDPKEKGLVYFAIVHWFLFWLLVSTFRSIFTPPGNIPQSWHEMQEKELSNYFELEQQVYRATHSYVQENRNRRTQTRGERQSNTTPRPSEVEFLPRTPNNEPNNELTLPLDILEERVSQVSQTLPRETLDRINDELNNLNTSKGNNGGVEDDKSVVDFGNTDEAAAAGVQSVEETPKANVNADWMRRLVLMTITKRVNVRYCSKCLMIKPSRCHHCRLCNQCVLKMDHHCPWIANCVGFNNHKYFMNMLFYSAVTLLFVSITYTECVADTLFDIEQDPLISYMVLFTFCLSFTLGTIVTMFFLFHLWLVMNGKTTIDYCEKKNKVNRYDHGCWKNFTGVFGENPLLWFFPLAPNTEGEGLVFPEIPDQERDQLVPGATSEKVQQSPRHMIQFQGYHFTSDFKIHHLSINSRSSLNS
eukprot:TRINITY_DN4552_c0_g1_i1.p1 TRINITY_DN4552_c0_g1~~TRINITY_DN4552_c0_g1_i1.p1  ORF type:complete len:471 (+),score=97.19 TRINITY_DN4552_c0_g1_i1:171-1583(+)